VFGDKADRHWLTFGARSCRWNKSSELGKLMESERFLVAKLGSASDVGIFSSLDGLLKHDNCHG